uniref:ADK_lid domain-containing protein n=1 Tax=Macrostomum lignano TaxID=282301 RepID=A0A1I8IZ41_9PLAT
MNRGELVPDSLVLELIIEEQSKAAANSHLLLDGFRGTLPQAENLCSRVQIDRVMNLTCRFNVIVERRWIHPGSGRTYHTEFNKPVREGFDDVTGEPLIQREDDKESVVLERLSHYKDLTEPVLEYFRQRGLLSAIYWQLLKRDLAKSSRVFSSRDRASAVHQVFMNFDL